MYLFCLTVGCVLISQLHYLYDNIRIVNDKDFCFIYQYARQINVFM